LPRQVKKCCSWRMWMMNKLKVSAYGSWIQGATTICVEKKELFDVFNEGFKDSVKLENDASLKVQGNGSIQMEIDEIMHVITEVFYVPDLKNNLLSIGQLQEKGLAVLM